MGPAEAPPTVADEFTAQIVVLQHPSALTVGYTPVFHCHTTQTACTFMELKKKLDPRTGQTKEENPTFLKSGDAAIVVIKPTKPMVIENVKELPSSAGLPSVIWDQTIAAGMCIAIQPKQMSIIIFWVNIMQKARIRLTGTDFKKVEMVCDRITGDCRTHRCESGRSNTASDQKTGRPNPQKPRWGGDCNMGPLADACPQAAHRY